MIVIPETENRTIVSSFLWTKLRNVTDRQTDRQIFSGYYRSLHCEQRGRAVKMKFWRTERRCRTRREAITGRCLEWLSLWPWNWPRTLGQVKIAGICVLYFVFSLASFGQYGYDVL